MKIGIIGAMEKEIRYIKENMSNIEVKEINHLVFYKGNINNNIIYLTCGGIGKTASGIVASILISNFDIDYVINIGVSGGNSDYVQKGDCVIGKYYSYADVDCTIFKEYKYGQIPDMPSIYEANISDFISDDIKYGMILSGDKFFINKDETSYIAKNYFSDYTVLAFDMESCALAQACYIYNKPFVAIRVISDIIGDDHQEDKYFDYVEIACKKANKVLFEFLKK